MPIPAIWLDTNGARRTYLIEEMNRQTETETLECDLAMVTPHVSRQHARVDVEDGRLYIEDLGSSNGTMINGKRAVSRQQLRHDDEVRLHDIIFRVTERLSRPHSERQAADQTTFIHASELKQGK